MVSIFSADHALHNSLQQYYNGAVTASYESPVRATIIRNAIARAGLGPIIPPRPFALQAIRAVHSDDYLLYLEHAYERWVAAGGTPTGVLPDTLATRWMARPVKSGLAAPGYYTFDLSAPIVAGTYQAARSAANVALTGAALLLEQHRLVYALCRPPGHHAGPDLCGGYCFLNNAAIAANYLVRAAPSTQPPRGHAERRVAILDIDFHHGNGTQQIFYTRKDVLFVSLHADPQRQYPYFTGYADERGAAEGLGYTLNIPLEIGVTNERYLAALEQALAVIAGFMPHFLVLSAGFDTFGGDPIGDFALTRDVYPFIGRRIAALGLPTLIVQEGGYAVAALGEHVTGLLGGFEL
jgi:acetoin utilization deacetylase AcuC-like enzyme